MILVLVLFSQKAVLYTVILQHELRYSKSCNRRIVAGVF